VVGILTVWLKALIDRAGNNGRTHVQFRCFDDERALETQLESRLGILEEAMVVMVLIGPLAVYFLHWFVRVSGRPR
jgi:hypothetical protein